MTAVKFPPEMTASVIIQALREGMTYEAIAEQTQRNIEWLKQTVLGSVEMIDVDIVKSTQDSLRINTEIHEPTHVQLMKTPPEAWVPIVVVGTRLIDGLQRLMVAKQHGFKQIPVTKLKAS